MPGLLLLAGMASSRGWAQVGSEACPGNLLVNPGFEAGFSLRMRPVEVVGSGWTPWYVRLPGVDGINYAPEYTPRRGLRDGALPVHAGSWSQEMATEGATHIAGVWQQVAIEPGSQVYASTWGYAWATHGGEPERSDPPGAYSLMLGMDPFGGRDPDSPNITWTTPLTVTDLWVPLTLDLPVDGEVVTLFLRGQALLKLAHNVSRWDDACLRVLGPAGEPTPLPTDTPLPTRTLRPGEPTGTPEPESILVQATRVSAALAGTAAALARPTEQRSFLVTPPGLRAPSSDADEAGDAPSAIVGSAAGAVDADVLTATADPDAVVEIPVGAWLADHLGFFVLAAAVFVGGWLWGGGWPRSRGHQDD